MCVKFCKSLPTHPPGTMVNGSAHSVGTVSGSGLVHAGSVVVQWYSAVVHGSTVLDSPLVLVAAVAMVGGI